MDLRLWSVGPGVKAAAHALHYGAGVPVRKLPVVLKELTGITLTQGAMTQDALRRGEAEVGARYRQLCSGMREAPVINTDDTGWRVGGSTAYRPAPGSWQPASLPPGRGARTDQQPGGAGTPPGGDRAQSFPLLEEPPRLRSFRGFRQCDSDSRSGGGFIYHRLSADSLLDVGAAIRLILLCSQPNQLPKAQSPKKTEGGHTFVARLRLTKARHPLINYLNYVRNVLTSHKKSPTISAIFIEKDPTAFAALQQALGQYCGGVKTTPLPGTFED